MVPGGCASVRQTIGDILSTANVVTAAAAQTREPFPGYPARHGSAPSQTEQNEIAQGPNLIRGRRHGTRGTETAQQRNGKERGGGGGEGGQRKQTQKEKQGE